MQWYSVYNSKGSYLGDFINYENKTELANSIIRRKINEKKKQKIFFIDDSFPIRLLDKNIFEKTKNINDADIIAIPDPKYIFFSSTIFITKNTSGEYIQKYHTTKLLVGKPYVYHRKIFDIMDDPRVRTTKCIYDVCRKKLPSLDESELDSIMTMLSSSDKDIRETGAMLVMKSNIQMNTSLCTKARNILVNCEKSTKEIRIFTDGISY